MKRFDPEAGIAKSRRNLPHWEQAGCTYFLTWRLADSLPVSKLAEWTESRDRWLALNPRPWSPTTAAEYNREFVARIEGWLDAGHGSCILRRPDVHGILAGALQFFHGQRYDLDACVIMPNHVHVLVTPYVTQAFQPGMETNPQAGKPVSHLISHSLSGIVQSWKGYSAREINRLLGRNGRLWMDENFDHAVRSADQLEHFRKYIRENPAKAGLRKDEYFLQCDTGFPACAEPAQQPGKAVPHSQSDTGFPACGSDTSIAREEEPIP